jgi:hypothetical protein
METGTSSLNQLARLYREWAQVDERAQAKRAAFLEALHSLRDDSPGQPSLRQIAAAIGVTHSRVHQLIGREKK